MNGNVRPQSVEHAVARVRDVDFSYGDLQVLNEVSLSVPAGAVTAVVGPNGSGKTTLALVVAGLAAPDGGERDLAAGGERPVGYLPQSPRFRPEFTVEETLTFYADLLSTPVDVEAAMDRVGLAGASDRRVAALSGGMRQLLGIAQALLGDPAMVVLDEPTSGLDPRMTRHVFEVIEDVAADGTGVFLTTHDLLHAEEADRIALLDSGTVLIEQPPDAFVANANADSLLSAFVSTLGEDPAVQTGEG